MLSEQNIPLANGDVYKLDTPLIEFMPDFKMYDDNATQHATTLDLLSEYESCLSLKGIVC